MSSYSKNEVILVKYPFSDLTVFKVRPAVIVGAEYLSQDLIIVPLTSRSYKNFEGEFMLKYWREAGLNVASYIKRGIYTIKDTLVIDCVGKLSVDDALSLKSSLSLWLGLHR